jgi:hypothetical protein
MLMPGLRIGLQEWAVCVRALHDGRSCLIVRKGGIHEPQGGTFKPEHERFVLLPSYLHQDASRLLPEFGGAYLQEASTNPKPGRIPISCWAEVTRAWRCEDLGCIQRLGNELIWTGDELATRFRYRSQPWLYVCALRVWNLPTVVDIHDHPSYGGCRSWIPLTDGVITDGARPAIPDTAFAARIGNVAAILGS